MGEHHVSELKVRLDEADQKVQMMEMNWSMMCEDALGARAELEAAQIEYVAEVGRLSKTLQRTQIECGQQIARKLKAETERGAEVGRLTEKLQSTQIECGQEIARKLRAQTEVMKVEEQMQALEGSWCYCEIDGELLTDGESQHWAQSGAMS